MAMAIICDRCKKVYPQIDSRFREYDIVKKTKSDPMRDYDDRKRLDICDECYLKLINFVCGGEKK